MEYIDYIGCSAITSLIEQSKLCHFLIYRYGASKQQAAIFECTDTATAAQAVDRFTKWASITKNSIAYDLVLTDKRGLSLQNDEEGKKNSKNIRVSFRLHEEKAGYSSEGRSEGDIVKMVVDRISDSNKDNAVLQKMDEIVNRLNKLENGEDEDEDDDSPKGLGALLGAITPTHIDRILDRFLPNITPPAALAGVTEDDRLNAALSTLKKNDANIVADLEKLALISENSPLLFKNVLTALREMK